LVVLDSDNQPREIPLGIDQLRSGSALYNPLGDRVQFRLEVNGDEKVSGVVLAVVKGGARTGPEVAAAGKPGQPLPNTAAPLPSPAGTSDQSAGAGASSPGKAARTFVPPPENSKAIAGQRTVYVDPPEVRGIQQNATATLPQTFQAPAGVAPPPPPAAPPAAPRPAEDLQVKQVEATYVNARPIHQVQPSLSPQMQKMLISRDTKMEVKAYVDGKGKVTRAEVISGSNHKILSNAVISAALAWKFEPARKNGVPQAAESTIVFVFHPPAGSPGR
jgi:protein TonB